MGIFNYLFAKGIVGFSKDASELIKEDSRMKEEKRQKSLSNSQDRMTITNFLSSINCSCDDYIYNYDTNDWSFIDDVITNAFDENTVCLFVDIRDTLSMLDENTEFKLQCHLVKCLFDSIYGYDHFDYENYINRTPCLIDHCHKLITDLLNSGNFYGKKNAIKYLLFAMDAELFVNQGDYLHAIKRYFSILKWDELIDNIYKSESFDFDGTEELYKTAVSNLINIFAILKMPDEANYIRSAFNRIVSYTRKVAQDILSSEHFDLSENQINYNKNIISALDSSFSPVGFYSIFFSGRNPDYELTDVYDNQFNHYYFDCFLCFEQSNITSNGIYYNKLAQLVSTENIYNQKVAVKNSLCPLFH